MRISANTWSRQLTPLSHPDEGDTVQYLKDTNLLIHHATIYICPLQCSVSVEQIMLDFSIYAVIITFISVEL